MSTAALFALIDKLPPMDMRWSDDLREAWLSIAGRLMAECEAQTICRFATPPQAEEGR